MALGIQGDLSSISDYAALRRVFHKYDKNDDGVISSQELSPLEMGDIDRDNNKAVTIPELMSARAHIFSQLKIQALRQLLDDPQVDIHMKEYGAFTALNIIDALIKRNDINIDITNKEQQKKNKRVLTETINAIKDVISRFDKNGKTIHFKDAAKIALQLLQQNIKLADIKALLPEKILQSYLKYKTAILLMRYFPAELKELNLNLDTCKDKDSLIKELSDKINTFFNNKSSLEIINSRTANTLWKMLVLTYNSDKEIALKIAEKFSLKTSYNLIALGSTIVWTNKAASKILNFLENNDRIFKDPHFMSKTVLTIDPNRDQIAYFLEALRSSSSILRRFFHNHKMTITFQNDLVYASGDIDFQKIIEQGDIYNKINLLVEQQKFKQAEELYEKAINIQPASLRALSMRHELVAYYYKNKNIKAGIYHAQKALEILDTYYSKYSNNYYSFHYAKFSLYLADGYEKIGDYSKSKKYCIEGYKHLLYFKMGYNNYTSSETTPPFKSELKLASKTLLELVSKKPFLAKEIIEQLPKGIKAPAYFRLGLEFYNNQFSPRQAWECFKNTIYATTNKSDADSMRADAYYYLGLLYLYANNDIGLAAKMFNMAIRSRDIHNKYPALYFLSQLKGATFISTSFLYHQKADNSGMNFHVSSNQKKPLSYEVRRYRIMNGQIISMVFNNKGQFVTLVPGEIGTLGNGRPYAFYSVKSLKGTIDFSVSFGEFKHLQYNNNILKALVELPKYFFSDLKKILVYNGSDVFNESYRGMYVPYKSELKITPWDKIGTFSHELLHHHDFFHLTKEERQIYRQISWHKGGHFATSKDQDHRDFSPIEGSSKPRLGYKLLTKWRGEIIKRKDSKEEGSMPYGLNHPYEDFATVAEDYYNVGDRLRKYVREQISQGNFEPAIKYAFIKHIVFKGAEFGLSNDTNDKSLTIEEIKLAIDEHLKKQPNSIRDTTLESFYYVYNRNNA